MTVRVVGAGLAGAEAAWQLAERGIPVTLLEMKPKQRTAAHHTDGFAELCCSNSLRSDRLENAAGLLKAEMRALGSLILTVADKTRVPAGGALAVDRERFSQEITRILHQHPNVTCVCEEITAIPDTPCVLATGPLTSDALATALEARFGALSFYDAAAPIVEGDTLTMEKIFRAARYGRGEDDYLNCPLNEAEYDAFYHALLTAETAPVHGFEDHKVFEGCMPVETLAKRGRLSLCYGPMRPVGLTDPRTGRRPFAVVQLRQEDSEGRLYNLVGFQTRLTFPEQRRVFGLIPGLEKAGYARYGVMHRNTFLNAPTFLAPTFEVKDQEGLFVAGQLSGVEGYLESAASGLLAGRNLAARLSGQAPQAFPTATALGALSRHVSTPSRDYQPMRVSFALIDPMPTRIRDKAARYRAVSQHALEMITKEETLCKP